MAVGKGATSLVELILKKFGDDTAGAAKELERLGGFPESVSQRMGGAAGTAGLAGLLAAGQSEDSEAGFITKGGKTLLEAFHGSPHKFDKFSMDQIGTGEGVQQYGHGLYFADDIDTAKGFQPRDRANEDWMYEQYKAAEEAGDQYMMDAWERAMMHDSPMELRASAADPDYDEYSQTAFAEVADALSANQGAGSLSRVEIDVTPESLLDYDKPLSEQADVVQSFFAGREGINADTSGRALTESLLKNRDPSLSLSELQKIASQEMNDGGIKGVQYQDWVNRAEGSDIRNYVIHDDSLINIAERGNADPRLLGGVAAGTAGLLALGASDDADAGVAGRVLSESGLAYKQLRKQVARNKQNGISPGNTVKQWVHDKKNTTYNDMNSYATKVDGGKGGDYYKQQTQNIVDQILEGVENPDKDLMAGLAEWNGARQSRELGHRPDWEKGAASPGLLGGTAAVTAGALATPALMKDEPFDPTAPLPAPDFATQMGKAGEVLGTVLDAPMTGLQGIARGLFGLIEGEDLVTAGAEANHMMKGGSEEGFDRVGDKVEGLFAPIDKQFPYLNVGKSAGDATSFLMSLFSPI